jgi:hypothetical protein
MKSIPLILVIVASLAGCRTTAAPEAVVSRFYDAYLQHPVYGVPSGAALQPFVPYLSERLKERLAAAAAHREQFLRNHPDSDEKPPFADGSYFTSAFEGAGHFELGPVTAEGPRRWRVEVRFQDAAKTASWTDAAIVVEESGRLVIDDIVFGGAGAFNPSGRLSEALAARDE